MDNCTYCIWDGFFSPLWMSQQQQHTGFPQLVQLDPAQQQNKTCLQLQLPVLCKVQKQTLGSEQGRGRHSLCRAAQ